MDPQLDVAIREATMDDVRALQAYAAALFSEGLPGLLRRPIPTLADEHEFVAGYAADNSVLLIAETPDAVVGLAGVQGRTLDQERHVGLLGISVAAGHRGRGIGRMLLERLVIWAPEHGIERIELEAFETNPRAIALYERLGFEHEGTRRAAVKADGRSIDVACMALLLPAPA